MKFKLLIVCLIAGICSLGAKEVKAKEIKVACVGNSITEGMKLANPAQEAYPAQLGELLGPDYKVGNFGKSGATLLNKGHKPYTKEPEYAAALEFVPDIVLIHLGINDTDPRNWPNYNDEFVSDYLALINSFKEVNPDVRVILAKLSPICPGHHRFKTGTCEWRYQIDQAIENTAALSGAELISFAYPLMDRRDLIPDNLHPTVEGAALLAETAAAAITGNYGGLQMPEIWQDGMVLQRGKPLTISGKANAGEQVTVKIAGQKKKTVTNNRGEWSVTLAPLKASSGETLTISTPSKTLKFKDVAIGEVWLASGQSNMEFQLRRSTDFASDTVNATDPDLRLFNVRPRTHVDVVPWTDAQRDTVDRLLYYAPTRWKKASPAEASNFSAVAWNFARMLRDSLQVPVGVICNAVGGSGTEAWIDPETLDRNVSDIFLNWRKNDYLQPWVKGQINRNCGEETPHRHPFEPSYLFSAGIRPLNSFPIAGVIWYQGESNAHNIELHETLFRLLVDSWRENWADEKLPFLTVQLSSLERPSWPQFRDSQRRLAEDMEMVGMAVSSDLGAHGDVHPRTKRPVGRRLGLIALNQVYGHADAPFEGPKPVSASISAPGTITLTMENNAGVPEEITSFEVADMEGHFIPAKAKPQGDKIILTYDKNVTPTLLRYGWQPYSEGNLTNANGLPASTFKIEVR